MPITICRIDYNKLFIKLEMNKNHYNCDKWCLKNLYFWRETWKSSNPETWEKKCNRKVNFSSFELFSGERKLGRHRLVEIKKVTTFFPSKSGTRLFLSFWGYLAEADERNRLKLDRNSFLRKTICCFFVFNKPVSRLFFFIIFTILLFSACHISRVF